MAKRSEGKASNQPDELVQIDGIIGTWMVVKRLTLLDLRMRRCWRDIWSLIVLQAHNP